MTRTIALASLIGFISQGVFGQYESAPLAFKVASIKPNQSGGPRNGVRAQGDNLTGKNVTLKQLMAYAYEVHSSQLSGPDWIETQGYDLTAAAKNAPTDMQLRMMLRALLEGRFKLKIHREVKEIPAYRLVVT